MRQMSKTDLNYRAVKMMYKVALLRNVLVTAVAITVCAITTSIWGLIALIGLCSLKIDIGDCERASLINLRKSLEETFYDGRE